MNEQGIGYDEFHSGNYMLFTHHSGISVKPWLVVIASVTCLFTVCLDNQNNVFLI